MCVHALLHGCMQVIADDLLKGFGGPRVRMSAQADEMRAMLRSSRTGSATTQARPRSRAAGEDMGWGVMGGLPRPLAVSHMAHATLQGMASSAAAAAARLAPCMHAFQPAAYAGFCESVPCLPACHTPCWPAAAGWSTAA